MGRKRRVKSWSDPMTQRQREWIEYRIVTAGVPADEERALRRRLVMGMTRDQAQKVIHDLWVRTEYADAEGGE